MRYVVVYEQSPRNWGAYVPDLPGCVAVAKTRRGTGRMIKQAIEMYLEATLENGDPLPQPGTWTGTVDVTIPSPESTKSRAITGERGPARRRKSA